jgi:hypothetical protein
MPLQCGPNVFGGTIEKLVEGPAPTSIGDWAVFIGLRLTRALTQAFDGAEARAKVALDSAGSCPDAIPSHPHQQVCVNKSVYFARRFESISIELVTRRPAGLPPIELTRVRWSIGWRLIILCNADPLNAEHPQDTWEARSEVGWGDYEKRWGRERVQGPPY